MDPATEQVANSFAWTSLAAVAGVGVTFYVGQRLQERVTGIPVRPSKTGVQRTLNWVFASYIASYGMLVPGLFCTLFSYDLSAQSGTMPLRAVSDSMWQFVHSLTQADAYLGAFFVVLYAMVIPALKLVLLVLSEVWRRGTPEQIMRARACVVALHSISKWACPDVFAYILLFYLLRSLNHPPVVQALADLGIGFTCFAIFCVLSTMAALGLKVPPLPAGQEPPCPKGNIFTRRPALLAFVVAVMCLAFAPLLVAGMAKPAMSLSVGVDSFFKPYGPLDPALKPAVADMHIDRLTHSKVTFADCIAKLAVWTFQHGEANSFIALVLLAVFVVASTVLNMLTLLGTSLLLWRRAAKPPRSMLQLLMRVSHTFKKLAFLDVAVVGVALMVKCGAAYKKQGVELHMELGLLLLLGAELCHYVAYYLVKHAVAVAVSSEPTNNSAEVAAARSDGFKSNAVEVDLESASTFVEDGADESLHEAGRSASNPEAADTADDREQDVADEKLQEAKRTASKMEIAHATDDSQQDVADEKLQEAGHGVSTMYI